MILISIKRALVVLKKKWFPIIAVTVILCSCYTAYNFLVGYNKLTMSMSLNYPIAEKGLNPDGSRFNVFEIKSAEVLDRVLEKYSETGITVDELRSRIDVYEKSSNTIAEKVKTAKISGDNFKYIPNEYTISYSQKNKLGKNHTYEMLSTLAQTYKEYFEEKYADNNAVLKTTVENIKQYENYEYVEIADLLFEDVTAIEAYISKRNSESSSFVSHETGQTFANLLSMIQNYKNIEVEKFKSFVVSSAIAKDRRAYINNLKYSANTLAFEKSKAVSEAEFTQGAIQKYDPNITGVAFIPSLDKENEFYMNRTKTGIDYLAVKAFDAGTAAEKLAKEIENNNYLISVFSNRVHDEVEEARLRAVADSMLEELKEKLLEIQEIATKTDDEYIIYKTRDYIKFSIPKSSFISSLRIARAVVFLLFSFIVVWFCFVVKEHFFKRRKTS
ncbi:MAG: hypothetical protein WCX81_01900 [Monoglobales bacterium]